MRILRIIAGFMSTVITMSIVVIIALISIHIAGGR